MEVNKLNVLSALRRIRACESEVPAQVVLEHLVAQQVNYAMVADAKSAIDASRAICEMEGVRFGAQGSDEERSLRANDIDLSAMEDVQFNTRPSECGGCIDVSVSCVMREDGEEMTVRALLARVRKMDAQALVDAIQEGMVPVGSVAPAKKDEGITRKTSMIIYYSQEKAGLHECPTPGCVIEPGVVIPTYNNLFVAFSAGWRILEGDFYCPKCSEFAGLIDDEQSAVNIQIDTVARTIQQWIDFTSNDFKPENKPDDMTNVHVRCISPIVPIGVLENWIKLLRSLEIK